jgi:hypothetical protein
MFDAYSASLQPATFLDQTMEVIKYNDFVNRELILFSMADLSRSIPSMVDGLKPSQRKILFCAFKRNFVTQAKVIMNANSLLGAQIWEGFHTSNCCIFVHRLHNFQVTCQRTQHIIMESRAWQAPSLD